MLDEKILDVLLFPNKKLRNKTEEITTINKDCIQLAYNMLETMYNKGGIGLASTQIGDNRRLIVIDIKSNDEEELSKDIKISGNYIIFNPTILNKSNSTLKSIEGCLSIPGVYAEIERASYVEVEGIDIEGNKFQLKASGLLAACIQHEIDHLDGKLFIDKISRLKRNLAINKSKKLVKKL